MKKLAVTSEIFTRGVEDIISVEELEGLLGKDKQIRVKHGIDATAPLLHIGHAVSLWKLRALQEAGHKAVILLGDVTTQVGDPTGKHKTRPVLSKKEIDGNIKVLKKQVESILLTTPRVYEFHKSSEWYSKITVPEFLKIMATMTHARLIERDMFRARVENNLEIYMHELIYPLLQGYDSVMLRSDLTVIGSDQLFNEHVGRMLQEKSGQSPQVIVSIKILPGLDGREKMSKSEGNFIALTDTPRDKFGKAMRVLDSLIIPYLEGYTDTPQEEIQKLHSHIKAGENPMQTKLIFAEQLVQRYHGQKIAKAERARFLNIFSKKDITDVPERHLPEGEYDVITLLVSLELVPSKSEARRLVSQRAVEINQKTITDSKEVIQVKKGTVLKVGKKRFVKII